MQTAGRSLAAVLVLAATFGCTSRAQLSPEARRLLNGGKDAYRRGDDEAAISSMSEFLARHGVGPAADEAYYYRGRAKYRLGDLPGAEADMNQALARTGDRRLRAGARIVLGDVAYESGKMALAERRYRLALRDVPRGAERHEYALFRLGCALQRQGKWAQADRRFDRQIYLFPNTALSALAERRVRAVAWTVLAGVYADRDDAAAAAAKLRAARLAPEIRPVRRDGRLLFVVQVGRHQTYERAAGTLEDVRTVQPGALVTVTR